ncbi:MAG: hypothetical protein GVY16_09900 [Planctomycetes bacterium]|nr:hypothetical protein [Planctomycetota bacterium]
MKRLARDYSVIYLTHRPLQFTAVSRAWLDRYDYPIVPLFSSTIDEFLEGSGPYKTARLGRKQVQRLLEAVPGLCPGEQQELRHPTHEVRLVLIHRQVLLLQEPGVSIEHLAQMAIVFRHIQLPLYPDLDNTRFAVVIHGPSSRVSASEGVHRSKRLDNARRWWQFGRRRSG